MVAEGNGAEQNPTCTDSEYVEALLEYGSLSIGQQVILWIVKIQIAFSVANFCDSPSDLPSAARYNDIEDVKNLAAIGVLLIPRMPKAEQHFIWLQQMEMST
ncbi:hypothetical protein HanIR_Chr00c24g0910621 [Helianthus annuus]|nr:hypothetical protein HanIR_Chr00c24g0910621 [Helianthus annuus]